MLGQLWVKHNKAWEAGARITRYEITDHEWTTIKPMLPNKPRGVLRATRYDKFAANYLAFVQLASIRLGPRVYESTP